MVTYDIFQSDGTTAYTGSNVFVDGNSVKTKTNTAYSETLVIYNVNNFQQKFGPFTVQVSSAPNDLTYPSQLPKAVETVVFTSGSRPQVVFSEF